MAQQLKFGARQLEALEADRFDELPGGTFARGMVRSYARLLKLDPEPLLARLAGRFDAPDSNQLAARFSQPVPFSDAGRRSTLVYLACRDRHPGGGRRVAWQWQRERNAPTDIAFVKPKAEAPARKAAAAPAPPAVVAAASAPALEERKPAAEAKKPIEEKKPAVEAKKRRAEDGRGEEAGRRPRRSSSSASRRRRCRRWPRRRPPACTAS